MKGVILIEAKKGIRVREGGALFVKWEIPKEYLPKLPLTHFAK